MPRNWKLSKISFFIFPLLVLGSCSNQGPTGEDNPFLDDFTNLGKADSGWLTIADAPEVELVLEGDIKVPGKWQFLQGPVDQSQFALTYLRGHFKVFMESQFVVPDHRRTVEWLIDGQWVPASQVGSDVDVTTLSHYRIVGINAIVYKPEDPAALVGKVYEAVVPRYPYFIMTHAGATCATNTSHALWDDDYWYFWDPDRRECELEKSTLTATVVKKIESAGVRYPEYDQLLKDGTITVIAFFGAFDSSTDPMENDRGYRGMESFCKKIEAAGFERGTSPDGLIRYSRTTENGLEFVVDVSTPKDFYGLDDYEHTAVFDQGIKTHEVVIYNGHSIFGTSNLWKRDIYPDFYQIFFFNGCLGYEYYVGAILDGKGSWEHTDVISNVKETPAAPQPKVLAAFIAALFQGAEKNGTVNFNGILHAISAYTYNSIYGVSGARTNCFSPEGSLCDDTSTYSNQDSTPIPDGDPHGVESSIDVSQNISVGVLSCSVDVTHPWISDLTIKLAHNGVEIVLWDGTSAGGGDLGTDLHETFTVDAFSDMDAAGQWTLTLVDNMKPDPGTMEGWSLTITKTDQ